MNGNFSLASAKALIRNARPPDDRSFWLRLWQFKGPVRASLTLWTIARDVLPTRSLLCRRRILPDASCCCCSEATQTTLHLLRDCPLAIAVWRLLVPPICWPLFVSSSDSRQWLLVNISCRNPRVDWPHHWPYIFRQTVHELWITHTRRLHDRSIPHKPYEIAIRCLHTVLGTLTAASYG